MSAASAREKAVAPEAEEQLNPSFPAPSTRVTRSMHASHVQRVPVHAYCENRSRSTEIRAHQHLQLPVASRSRVFGSRWSQEPRPLELAAL